MTPVTAVIPTYNRGRCLARAIASVLSQTAPPAEVLIIDDGSTDNTRDVVLSFDDPRVRYIRQHRKGANAARNLGLAESESEWVAFQDSDDYWMPNKLERQFEALREHHGTNPLACFCRVLEYDQRRARLFPLRLTGTQVLTPDSSAAVRILSKNLISTQTLLINRYTAIQMGGFDEGLPRFQDWEFAIRLLNSVNVVYIAEPLVVAEKVADSLTRDYEAGILARRLILQKHEALFRKFPLQNLIARLSVLARVSARHTRPHLIPGK